MMAGSALAGRGPSLADEALAHARAIAADWRAAGLQVDLIEHTLPDGRPGGCALVARSPTRVLHCACRPATSRDGRALWTVEVSLGRCEDDRDGIEHVRLRTAGTAVAGACGPAWRQVLDWLHGVRALDAGPEAAPVPAGRRRGWAAGVARCRARLRTAIGWHLGAPDPAGVADRLGRTASPPRWRGAATPLLEGGLACLAGLVTAVGGVCLAGRRFAARDERAYRAYARMCAAAVHDGAAAEDEFWRKLWAHAALAGSGDGWIAEQAATAQELLAKIKTMPEGPEKKAAAKAAIVTLQQRTVDRLNSQHDDCVADQTKFHDPNDPVMIVPTMLPS